MAFRFQIKGNFLVVSDFASRVDVIRKKVSEVVPLRQGNYFIFLNSGQILNFEGAIRANTFGVNEDIFTDAPASITQTVFLYSDCEDESGVAFTSADALDTWLSENTGQDVVITSVFPNLEQLANVSISGANGGDMIVYNDVSTNWQNLRFTLTFELIDPLTVDYYPPYDIEINSLKDQKNAATFTVLVNGAAYSFGDPINAYDKITVTATVADVVTYNATLINIIS